MFSRFTRLTRLAHQSFAGSCAARRFCRFFEKLSPCLIGMEACGSAHHWGRKLSEFGHDVRLIPACYVKPYIKRGKSDAIDAAAICEAVTRPSMRFVPIKSLGQQSSLMLHRTRDLLVRQQTALINALRGHLAEFGLIAAKGISKLPDLDVWSRNLVGRV